MARSALAKVAGRSSGTTSSSAERPISSSGAQPSTRCHELLTSRKRPSEEKTASRSCESSQNPDLSESAAAAATTARSRSIAAISTCAIDSTKARSSVENAARRRLHATNAPNAAAPDPVGAATRLRIPKASSAGARKCVSDGRCELSRVSPLSQRSASARRSSREGTAEIAKSSPALARIEGAPSAVRSSTTIRSLASVS